MKCICGKIAFKDAGSCYKVIREMSRKAKPRKLPVRAYRCSVGGKFWHMTSNPLKKRRAKG